MKWKLFTLFTFIAFNLACALLPAAASQSTPIAGEIIYQDDFSDAASGWETWSESHSTTRYENGGLRFVIFEKQFDYWSRPGKTFADTHISVEATKLDGPDNNDFGVICRYQNNDNFYAFLVSSDGYYGIMKVKNGQYLLLNGLELQYSEAIHKGRDQNKIEAECNGINLTLWANGEVLAAIQDGDFSKGEVGLIAGAYDTSGVDILFDNFIVSKP